MKNFKKLTLSSLILAALSSSAVWAENTINAAGLDYVTLRENGLPTEETKKNVDTISITPLVESDDNIRIHLREDPGSNEAEFTIRVATQLRYSDEKGEKLKSQFTGDSNEEINRTDHVVLIGGKGVTSSGVTIHNVGEGELKENGKQAVNSGQLFETNKRVVEVDELAVRTSTQVVENTSDITELRDQTESLGKRANETDSKFKEIVKGFESVNTAIATNDKATREAFEGVGKVFKGVEKTLNDQKDAIAAVQAESAAASKYSDSNILENRKAIVRNEDKIQSNAEMISNNKDAIVAARAESAAASKYSDSNILENRKAIVQNQDDIHSNAEKISNLNKRADDTDSKFGEVVKGFESVNNTIATNEKATREAFEGVGEAFKGVASTLNGHGEQLTALDKRTTDTNKEVTAVKTTVAGLDKVQKEHTTKLDTLTGRADAADTARKQISVALSGLEGRLNKTDTTVGTLATQLNDHGVKLNALDKKIASVDKKAQQGIAAALAVAALPQAVLPNESVVAFGAGNWRSENGVAIGVSHASGNGKWLFKVGAVNAGSNFGANAGIGYRW